MGEEHEFHRVLVNRRSDVCVWRGGLQMLGSTWTLPPTNHTTAKVRRRQTNNVRASYLDTSVLSAAVDGLVGAGVDSGEDVTHVVMRVDRIKTFKCPC